MAIRFHLDDDPGGDVGVALSPLCEAVLSLHVLIKPKYHPVQHPWIRAMRTLPPALKREVRAFTPFYVDAIPDVFLPHGEGASFEDELRVLEELKPGRIIKTNVEYYAAAVLQGVGLPPEVFPATFALARHAGWTAHCIEQAAANRCAVLRSMISKYSSTERSIAPRRWKARSSPSVILSVAWQRRWMTSIWPWLRAICMALV